MEWQSIRVTLEQHVARLELNRPDKANALDARMWNELREAMQWVDRCDEARVAILSGAGRLRLMILDIQDTVSAIERCRKPVIAQIHGACVGGGIDIVSACDMRYCSDDAWFSVKEVDVGLTADVGTLQRLPKLIGEGMARELAHTARRVGAAEAQQIRLVNRACGSVQDLAAAVAGMAALIASKPPLALRGTKEMITYARDHSVADGLNYIATWNAAMLLSSDLEEALAAQREKRAARFRD
jgi:enoyl-CoA hydratase